MCDRAVRLPHPWRCVFRGSAWVDSLTLSPCRFLDSLNVSRVINQTRSRKCYREHYNQAEIMSICNKSTHLHETEKPALRTEGNSLCGIYIITDTDD